MYTIKITDTDNGSVIKTLDAKGFVLLAYAGDGHFCQITQGSFSLVELAHVSAALRLAAKDLKNHINPAKKAILKGIAKDFEKNFKRAHETESNATGGGV